MLIEIENRHNNNNTKYIVEYIMSFQYKCYFYYENKLVNVKSINYENQEYKNKYINNFIFIPIDYKNNNINYLFD
jgi:hypothetical protein